MPRERKTQRVPPGGTWGYPTPSRSGVRALLGEDVPSSSDSRKRINKLYFSDFLQFFLGVGEDFLRFDKIKSVRQFRRNYRRQRRRTRRRRIARSVGYLSLLPRESDFLEKSVENVITRITQRNIAMIQKRDSDIRPA